jgi:hypothetical protein
MASVGETKESNEASDSPARAQSNADYLDGPWRAWSTGKKFALSIAPGYLTSFSVVIGTFIVQFYVVGVVCNGIMNQVSLNSHIIFPKITAFGVFQDFYTREWLNNCSASTISWIGGVTYFFELGCAVGEFTHKLTSFL